MAWTSYQANTGGQEAIEPAAQERKNWTVTVISRHCFPHQTQQPEGTGAGVEKEGYHGEPAY